MHFEGWAHFIQGADELKSGNRIRDCLVMLAWGQRADVCEQEQQSSLLGMLPLLAKLSSDTRRSCARSTGLPPRERNPR